MAWWKTGHAYSRERLVGFRRTYRHGRYSTRFGKRFIFVVKTGLPLRRGELSLPCRINAGWTPSVVMTMNAKSNSRLRAACEAFLTIEANHAASKDGWREHGHVDWLFQSHLMLCLVRSTLQPKYTENL